MHDIKLFHFDDFPDSRTSVKTYIISMNKDYRSRNINVILNSLQDHNNLVEMLVDGDIPEILILDMYDNDNNVGEKVLQTIKELELNIPTIIFTQGSRVGFSIDYERLRREYTFIRGKEVIKSTSGTELKERIKNIIEDLYENSLFEIDEDDFLLKTEIRSIGRRNLNSILSLINPSVIFRIERMSSGFSGAAVFKLLYGNNISVLKVSNEKHKLKSEHEKSQLLYKKFPRKFRIDIQPKEYETEHSYAILIENVDNATTLFDWLKKTSNKTQIEVLLTEFYSESKSSGLGDFYKNNSEEDSTPKVKFTQIFKTFETNYALILSVIKELNPIIDYTKSPFNATNIKNLLLNGNYDKIDKDKLIGEQYVKSKILCHGDFHSKNIMVQNNCDPVIIDTGGIKYDYWCVDICRLIVHLFIVGFDIETVQYYDIVKIKDHLKIAEQIISLRTIEEDGDNNGYIHAINWLINNLDVIYGNVYNKWEFQLGLCKEFLQASYRVNSIPPNKRALALLAAYQCILLANENID